MAYHPEVIDEVSALKSIFCNPGEFNLLSPSSLETLEEARGPISFKIAVNCSTDVASLAGEDQNTDSFVVEISVTLRPSYPKTLPEISLSCTKMTKKTLFSLRDKLIEYAASNSNPTIMDLTLWLQENAGFFQDKPTLNNTKNNITPDYTVLLLKLDHIRNRSRYIKTMTRWTEELKLSGRILFVGHLIFILLTGVAEDIKEYLRRHKSCNIDVDSSGKPCKERMMTVLAQEQAPANLR